MEDTQLSKLRDLGFNIFPLEPMTKKPINRLNWKQFQTEKYKGIFPDSYNIAVVCGAISDNIFVVDLDDESLYDDIPEWMKQTYTIQTGRGKHLYFHYNGLPPSNKSLTDLRGRSIDIKSEGGYVLAEKSYYTPTDNEKHSHKYTKENENGFYYKMFKDVPILEIEIPKLREELEKIGFKSNSTSIEKLKNGVEEGSRDDGTFIMACHYVREGLFGTGLKFVIDEMNSKNKPPLSEGDISRIINSAVKYESKHQQTAIREAKRIKDEYIQQEPIKLKMQDIDPKIHENIQIIFDCMITAVGERLTYTKEANCFCPICGEGGTFYCNEYYIFGLPKCKKDGCAYRIESKETAYIQQLIIEEFLEDSKNSSPITFNGEIIDESIGQAFMGQRKTLLAKLRSIPDKTGRNTIVFDINDMKDLTQQVGSLPDAKELKSWLDCDNFFDRVTASIVPELLMDTDIIQCVILWGAIGTGLNGKRSLIHLAIIGDAQLGKSEILLKMHELLIGSGMTVGGKTSGAGLTIGMVKTHNGMMIPRAGFFPQYTGHHCMIDEGDKMTQIDQDSCLEVQEHGTATLTKVGIPSMTLPAQCPLLFSGNPKGGKFNSKFPAILDNFNMSEPFISRFDQVWCVADKNDPALDKKIIKFIRSFKNRKDDYMKVDELQRYFKYVQSLDATISDELMDKIDIFYEKMRPLNRKNGLPIGLRQYHGLHRLVTASATAHLRTVATQVDLDLVIKLISGSLKSMNMDIKTGKAENIIPEKRTKETEWLEAWAEVIDKELNTVDREEFIEALSKKEHYRLTAQTEWDKHKIAGHMDFDDINRWNWKGFK